LDIHEEKNGRNKMGNGKEMNSEVMKDRTKKFAKQIIYLCRKLPKNREGNLIGNQIEKSKTICNPKSAICNT
jgi:hypothetical protein